MPHATHDDAVEACSIGPCGTQIKVYIRCNGDNANFCDKLSTWKDLKWAFRTAVTEGLATWFDFKLGHSAKHSCNWPILTKLFCALWASLNRNESVQGADVIAVCSSLAGDGYCFCNGDLFRAYLQLRVLTPVQ